MFSLGFFIILGIKHGNDFVKTMKENHTKCFARERIFMRQSQRQKALSPHILFSLCFTLAE